MQAWSLAQIQIAHDASLSLNMMTYPQILAEPIRLLETACRNRSENCMKTSKPIPEQDYPASN
jgi:hypothetical protein